MSSRGIPLNISCGWDGWLNHLRHHVLRQLRAQVLADRALLGVAREVRDQRLPSIELLCHHHALAHARRAAQSPNSMRISRS
jgi:hypothetical protein